jgi:hypothetical protein
VVPVVHDVLSQFANGGVFSFVEAAVLVGVDAREEAVNAVVRRQIVGNVGAPEEVEVWWELVAADLAVFVVVQLYLRSPKSGSGTGSSVSVDAANAFT